VKVVQLDGLASVVVTTHDGDDRFAVVTDIRRGEASL
jgi:hypothetical protein